MKTYTPDELKEVLDKHHKWTLGEDGGSRADLSGVDVEEEGDLCAACYTDMILHLND